jgi:hypothetical protein
VFAVEGLIQGGGAAVEGLEVWFVSGAPVVC